ncbi:MAG: type II toxin-antitoxin system RelE/ParE family toxin [Bacteroidota bacterium]
MNYHISKEAALDLEEIWSYSSENWSVQQADRYIDLIFDEIDFLSLRPTSGTSVSHIRKGYFRSTVKSHLIFYKVSAKKEGIEIIRILHYRMDVEDHFRQ